MLNITRGDSKSFYFRRKDNEGHPILIKANKIYFTIKTSYYDTSTVLQKTIDDMEFDEEGYYHFTITPEDTKNLDYGKYVYDIEVKEVDYTQTISKGEISIDYEVTFIQNEV